MAGSIHEMSNEMGDNHGNNPHCAPRHIIYYLNRLLETRWKEWIKLGDDYVEK